LVEIIYFSPKITKDVVEVDTTIYSKIKNYSFLVIPCIKILEKFKQEAV
jgi:hypothetical protein